MPHLALHQSLHQFDVKTKDDFPSQLAASQTILPTLPTLISTLLELILRHRFWMHKRFSHCLIWPGSSSLLLGFRVQLLVIRLEVLFRIMLLSSKVRLHIIQSVYQSLEALHSIFWANLLLQFLDSSHNFSVHNFPSLALHIVFLIWDHDCCLLDLRSGP